MYVCIGKMNFNRDKLNYNMYRKVFVRIEVKVFISRHLEFNSQIFQ